LQEIVVKVIGVSSPTTLRLNAKLKKGAFTVMSGKMTRMELLKTGLKKNLKMSLTRNMLNPTKGKQKLKLFASTFWMLLKRINMVGFGNVLKAKDVYIAMHCHLDSN